MVRVRDGARRRNGNKSMKKWSKQETADLEKNYPYGGADACKVARKVRTVPAIRVKANILGIAMLKRCDRSSDWTDFEVAEVERTVLNRVAGVTVMKAIAKCTLSLSRHSPGATLQKAMRLQRVERIDTSSENR